MTTAETARRIATAAAYGGGTVTVLGASLYGLLTLQAKVARRTIGVPNDTAPFADGVYGHYAGDSLSFVLLGDSSAAGLGVADPAQTPGALLAAGLGELAQRPVLLTNVAKVGARSAGLDEQVKQALEARPDVALIIIGANDVTHRVPLSTSVRYLVQAVTTLREAGCEVVVGTCPDLGTIEPIPHPLRWIARRWSRQLAASQTVGVVERGGRTVSLGTLLGPEFALRPSDMFSADRFHPSAHGYAAAAAAMLPALAGALKLVPEEPATTVGVLPVADAAAAAVDSSGTEVAGTSVSGDERGPWGRWALLLRPRRRALPQVELAEDTMSATTSHAPPDGSLAGDGVPR
jgi:lysophospholipase L1-like esterase